MWTMLGVMLLLGCISLYPLLANRNATGFTSTYTLKFTNAVIPIPPSARAQAHEGRHLLGPGHQCRAKCQLAPPLLLTHVLPPHSLGHSTTEFRQCLLQPRLPDDIRRSCGFTRSLLRKYRHSFRVLLRSHLPCQRNDGARRCQLRTVSRRYGYAHGKKSAPWSQIALLFSQSTTATTKENNPSQPRSYPCLVPSVHPSVRVSVCRAPRPPPAAATPLAARAGPTPPSAPPAAL